MASVADPSSMGGAPGGPRQYGNPAAPPADGQNGGLDPVYKQNIRQVLSSEIGITTLLNRLKQSISSTRDFASFLKERASLEEKHANGLKRLSQNTHNLIARPESRQGSFAQSYQEMARAHERVADHGLTFSNTLYAMSDELHELATTSERGRKHWKQTGLNAEKRAQDAQMQMEKAKAKYNSLAEQYDRVRTGERAGGKFGLKKSAAAEEENLQRKLEVADGDYSFKVQAAQTSHQELTSSLRPQTINALQELIFEADAGLGVHVQKFALQSEKLLLGYGLSITPMKGQNPNGGPPSRSLRELASSINNDKDFADYILGFSNKPGPGGRQNQYSQDFGSEPYGQNYGQGHGRQMSGVASYQDPSYDDEGYGNPGPGPQSQAQPGPGQNYAAPRPQQLRQPSMDQQSARSTAPSQATPSAAPQLPQLDALGSDPDGQTPGIVAAGGPPNQNRNISQPTGTAPPFSNEQTGQNPPRGASLGQGSDFTGSAGPAQGPPASVGPPRPQQTAAGAGAAPRPPAAARQLSSESRPAGTGPPGAAVAAPAQGTATPGATGAAPVGRGRGAPPGAGRGTAGPPGAGRGTGRGTAPPGAGRGTGATGVGRGTGPAGRGTAAGRGTGPPGAGRGTAPRPAGAGPGPQSNGPPPAGTAPIGAPQAAPPMGGTAADGTPGPAPRAPGAGPSTGAPRPAGAPLATRSAPAQKSALPPLKPVFGVSLDDLFQREGSAVPTIVYQCIQAVDLHGLDTEGIYRTSGSANHIMELRQQFDHDSALVDFRDPSVFHEDIASVTTLLKHFLRDLPEPLLTSAQYQAYIQAAKLDEDIVRRDSVHALVNALPDPNYATLRVLVLHLHRIAQRSDKNKMTASNLAIVFAPTLMGQQGATNGQSNGMTADIADAGWQAKVIETILDNVMQIFDDDD